MNNKINTDEIIQLLPDYITGELSDADKALVENALASDPHGEINALYNEMKSALSFAETIKHTEPSPQYWNSLLPKIHDRIDSEQSKSFSWENLSAVWKFLIPVAAVILIALVYYIVKPSNTQFTEEKKLEQKQNEQKQNEQKQNEQKQNELKKDDSTQKPENNKENILKKNENKVNDMVKDENKTENKVNNKKRANVNHKDNESIAKDNTPEQKIDVKIPELNNDDQFADENDIDETAIFSGEAAGLDEETEGELSKLNDTEQNDLLKELLKTNL